MDRGLSHSRTGRRKRLVKEGLLAIALEHGQKRRPQGASHRRQTGENTDGQHRSKRAKER